MIVIFSVLFLIYGSLILYLSNGIRRLETMTAEPSRAVQELSVVVPFRNEQAHLPYLLECFKNLDYPKVQFEVLLVDDHSEDRSVAIIEEFMQQNPDLRISLLKNSREEGSPKKRAIEKAIDHAVFPWIVTTDADCRFGRKWLMALDQIIEEKYPVMLVGPVSYDRAGNFLERFQLMDFLSLQGTTMGSFGNRGRSPLVQPFLCNGANLAYSKSAFEQIEGFKGNHQIASGDDVFLLEKMLASFPYQVHYLKSEEALVYTAPQPSWKSLIQQRVRWASKTSSIGSRFGKMLGILVLAVNLSMLSLPFFALAGLFSWTAVGLLFLLKFNIDFIMIYRTAEVFDQKEAMRNYFLSSLVYPLYSVCVAFWSLVGGYSWKGRQY